MGIWLLDRVFPWHTLWETSTGFHLEIVSLIIDGTKNYETIEHHHYQCLTELHLNVIKNSAGINFSTNNMGDMGSELQGPAWDPQISNNWNGHRSEHWSDKCPGYVTSVSRPLPSNSCGFTVQEWTPRACPSKKHAHKNWIFPLFASFIKKTHQIPNKLILAGEFPCNVQIVLTK